MCSSSSLLPGTPSAFQHASRRGAPFVRLGHAAIFRYEKDDGFQDDSGSSCPWGKVGKCCEEPTSQLHTRINGEVIEEIRDFLDGRLGGFGGLGLLVVSTFCLAPFAGARLGVLTLGSGILFSASFTGPGTLSSVGGFVTGLGSGLDCGAGAASRTRPPRTTWLQPPPRLCCSAYGTGRAVFATAEEPAAAPEWEVLVGARLARPSPLSTLNIPCSWQCGFPRNRSI
jgi:hypothetical protein